MLIEILGNIIMKERLGEFNTLRAYRKKEDEERNSDSMDDSIDTWEG